MRAMFEFRCRRCFDTFESLENSENRTIPCPSCHDEATRIISAPRIDPRLGVDAASFPSMGDKWARVRRQRAEIEAKHAREGRGLGHTSSSGADIST